jgi:hypothetical protein
MALPLFNNSHLDAKREKLFAPVETRTGVILDLANSMQPVNQTKRLEQQFLAPLGISMLQLRLVDGNSFALELEQIPSTAFSWLPYALSNTSSDMRDLVEEGGRENRFPVLTNLETGMINGYDELAKF